MIAGAVCLRVMVAGAALAAAVVLWLGSAPAGHGESANQPQGVSAAVAKTISWGSGGGCTQTIAAYDFGTLAAGASAESSAFTGCVTSSARWSVTASMTTPPTNAAESETLAASNFIVRVTGVPPSGTTACDATNTSCALDASRTLVNSAGRGQRAFSYKYALSVPATQAGGSYSGGIVTLVASN